MKCSQFCGTIEHILDELKKGNRDFAKDSYYQQQREETFHSQTPCSVFVSCSDSRTSVPIIFSTSDIGEFFEVKVAGQVTSEADVESIKYAINHLGDEPKILIILGHSNCGAVVTTVKSILHRSDYHYREEFPTLTSTIAPSVYKVINRIGLRDEEQIIRESIVQNTIDRANELKFLFGKHIKVIPAVYDILSGKVNWLDGHCYHNS